MMVTCQSMISLRSVRIPTDVRLGFVDLRDTRVSAAPKLSRTQRSVRLVGSLRATSAISRQAVIQTPCPHNIQQTDD